MAAPETTALSTISQARAVACQTGGGILAIKARRDLRTILGSTHPMGILLDGSRSMTGDMFNARQVIKNVAEPDLEKEGLLKIGIFGDRATEYKNVTTEQIKEQTSLELMPYSGNGNSHEASLDAIKTMIGQLSIGVLGQNDIMGAPTISLITDEYAHATLTSGKKGLDEIAKLAGLYEDERTTVKLFTDFAIGNNGGMDLLPFVLSLKERGIILNVYSPEKNSDYETNGESIGLFWQLIARATGGTWTNLDTVNNTTLALNNSPLQVDVVNQMRQLDTQLRQIEQKLPLLTAGPQQL